MVNLFERRRIIDACIVNKDVGIDGSDIFRTFLDIFTICEVGGNTPASLRFSIVEICVAEPETVAPFSMKIAAMDAPMPRVAPLTKTVLPSNKAIVSSTSY